MKFKLFFILLTLLFFSCTDKKKESNDYSSVLLNYGGEKMLIENHKDSLNIEHITVFDSTGRLSKKITLNNNLKNSEEKGFYNSGNLKYQSNYKNDTLEGRFIWYYDNKDSSIKSIYNYEKGKLAGNHRQFNIKGNLERYFSTTFKEQITFDIHFDEDKKEKAVQKNKYKTMGVFKTIDFNINDTIEYTAYFSTPKNVKIEYFYSLSPIETNNNYLKNVELINSKIYFDTLINKKGTYILKEKILINRLDLDSTFFEEYFFKVNVK